MALATGIDITVIVVYMVAMIAVGVVLSFFNKTDSDFFKSANKMPWWLAGFSLFMSSISVWTFTGAAGVAYRAPGAVIAMYLSTAAGMVFGVWFLAGLWRRTRAGTILSYLSERYGIATNQTYSWTLLSAQMVQGGIQLLALGKFISVAMGTGLGMTIITCGLVISFYCLIGGLWAVAVTDTLQFVVLFSCAVVVMILGVGEIGGVATLFAGVQEGFWQVNTQEFDWWYVLAFGVMMFFAMNSGVLSQRYFSVKNEREARKVALLTMILFAITPFIWFLPPVAARIIGLDLSSVTLGLNAPEEAAYVAFCMHILPQGAIGVMLAAMLSATMSSLSSVFNAYAAVITEDIVKQVFWKKATPRALLVLGRVMTLVFGVLVIAAALTLSRSTGGVFRLMMTYSGVVIIPSGIPIVLGLFYRATPRWAGTASYLTGAAVGVAFLVLDTGITFTQQVFAVGGVSAAIYLIPGFFIKPGGRYKETLHLFFTKLASPVSRSEIGDTSYTDTGSFRVTGWAALIMGSLASCLAFLDLPVGDRMINLAIGVLIASFGITLIVACKLGIKKKNAC
ncbi:hypothetical protein ACFL4P_00340 [Gemmatimonadota bacterium]